MHSNNYMKIAALSVTFKRSTSSTNSTSTMSSTSSTSFVRSTSAADFASPVLSMSSCLYSPIHSCACSTSALSSSIRASNQEAMIFPDWISFSAFSLIDASINSIISSRNFILKKRDITERGRNIDEVLSRYQTTLKPMHQEFIEPTKNFADLIIPNDRYNNVAIDIVRTVINERLYNIDLDFW